MCCVRVGVLMYIVADHWKHWLVLNINGTREVDLNLEGEICGRVYERFVLCAE